MIDTDISRVEHALDVCLPAEYAALLRAYPFSEESWVAESYLWNDPKLVIDANTDLQSVIGQASSHVAPDARMLQIGFDGGEEIYLIDLQRRASPVYVYDFEDGSISEKCSGLDTWIIYCRTVEAEVLADEAAMANRSDTKRWWEFWK